MNLPPLTTLALDIGDIITVVILVAAGIGSVIANSAEQKKNQQKSRTRVDAAGGSSEGSGGTPSMEELARRRREQLRELARQRREQLSHGRASTEPDNLTTTEAAQRERARQAYAQRAQSLRAEKQTDAIEDRARELRQAEQTRQQREVERARKRQEQLEALRRRYQQRQGTPAQQPQRQRPPIAQPQPAPVTAMAEQERQAIKATAVGKDEIGSGRARPGKPLAGAQLSNLMGGSVSWRDAIVLKEILDHPVGLRTDEQLGVWM